MPASRLGSRCRATLHLIFPLAGAFAVACAGSRTARQNAPPAAEFLVNTADSTFWVSTAAGESHVRGAPMVLARYDGRFYELYTADDDRSYADALMLGERLYRRDLLTGDSTIVFADTTVPRIADAYARTHPNDTPLAPDEDGNDDPSTSATAEVDILDVIGPYVSYEYHVDVDLRGRRPWHSTRRGVIDLRTARASDLADLFGARAASRVATAGRKIYQAAIDSIGRAHRSFGGDNGRAAAALARLHFDDHSFSLTTLGGQPAVSFGVPGQGTGGDGAMVELDPLEVDSVSWWSPAGEGIPQTDATGDDAWTGAGYRVLARYDTSGDIAQFSIADSSRREWPIGNIAAPIRRVDWLDRPAASPAERRALLRAFDQASSYDENARVASSHVAPNLHHVTINASFQARSRQPARNVGADDARARQQHGSRVRRRGALDDGQDRRDRGVSSQPQ
ncbi:MAG TPA: hypothetical protein VGM67_20665 [Gemmatimonadaceae bacterium]|jgi:hypothetical protein